MGQPVFKIKVLYSDNQTYAYEETVGVAFDEAEAIKMEDELKAIQSEREFSGTEIEEIVSGKLYI